MTLPAWHRGALLVAAALLAAAASAQDVARREQPQIDRLIAAVAESGCRIERNGAWHEPGEAAAHLRRKLAVAGRRVQTAREFIDHVASGSSVSGRPYRVQCGGAPPVAARDWLLERLARP